ncbi:MAG TPA: hypothetical protein VH418_03225 [Solirubrobacteraceae bacterium]
MGGVELEDLTQMAEHAARARGHELGGWDAPAGEETIALRAVCRRCGRVAYIRSEGGLAGTAGDALSETCSG